MSDTPVYFLIPTDTGRAKMAAALLEQRDVELAAIAFGDGNGAAVTPSPSATTLAREVWRSGQGDYFDVSGDPANPTWVIVGTAVPLNTPSFLIREAGVIDADGDLFAYGNLPEICKASLEEGVGMEVLFELVIAVSEAESVTIALTQSLLFLTQDDLDRHNAADDAHQGKPVIYAWKLSGGDMIISKAMGDDTLDVSSGYQGMAVLPGKTAWSLNANRELVMQLPA